MFFRAENNLPVPVLQRFFSYVFFWKYFITYFITFRSMTNLELIFEYSVKLGLRFVTIIIKIQLFYHHLLKTVLLKKRILSPLNFLSIFSEHQLAIDMWLYLKVYYSVSLMYISFHPYNTVLMSIALEPEIGLYKSFNLFFKFILAIPGPLKFHLHFTTSLSISPKIILLWSYSIYKPICGELHLNTIEFSNSWTWYKNTQYLTLDVMLSDILIEVLYHLRKISSVLLFLEILSWI